MTLRDRLLTKLDELLALDKEALPEPWGYPFGGRIVDRNGCAVLKPNAAPRDGDAQFIVQARTYGPAAWRALMAEVEAHKRHADSCPTLRRIASEILEGEE